MRYLFLTIALILVLNVSADWPPTLDGHEIYDNSTPIIKLEKTDDKWVFPGTIEATAIIGASVEVDLTPYTKRDGTQAPTADWDMNGIDLTNIDNLDVTYTLECHTLKALTLEIGTTSALVWYNEVNGKLYLKDGNVEINITDLDIEVLGKMNQVVTPVPGNFVGLTAGGDASDSGVGASDYYLKGDLYTSGEVDTAIDTGIANADLEDLANVASGATDGQVLEWDNSGGNWTPVDPSGGSGKTTTEIESIIDDYSYNSTEVYTQTETDNLLDDKADVATTYTKTETDDLLDDKADTATTYTILETDATIEAYAYDKSTVDGMIRTDAEIESVIDEYSYNSTEVYTKTEIDNRVLNDLSNVNVSAPSDGEVLTWDSGESEWTSEVVASAIGATTEVWTSDGSGTYVLAHTPISGDVKVTLDQNTRQRPGLDFTVSGNTVTFVIPIYLSGDLLYFDYIYEE